MPKIPVIFPPDGMQAADVNSYAHIPSQADAGLGIAKDPQSGAWTSLTHYPGLEKAGYLTLEYSDGTKSRVATFDHPDGG